jgi:DNA transposition AAA+ family ATPase
MNTVRKVPELEVIPLPLRRDESEPAWVETPTCSKIIGALEYARATPTISIIFGAAGVSKTTAARWYASQHRFKDDGSAYYITAARWIRSCAALLQSIAEAVGTSSHAYRNDSLARATLSRMGRGDIIIVDEAQNLGPDALDGLRFFLDEGQIGIALSGNEEVYSRIAGKNRRAMFAQLSSRIGMRVHVPQPTEADVDAIVEAWGTTGKLEREFAQQIALGPGGIRQLVQVMRQAKVAATSTRRALDHRLMRASAAALGLEV